jgi:hypothetical protein
MGDKFQWLSAIACVLCSSSAVANGADASQPPIVQEIISAWERRQADIGTAEFAWTTERTDRKGSVSESRPPTKTKGPPVPSVDSTYSSQDAVWFDGRRVRWEHDGPRRFSSLDPPDGRLIPMKQVSVFDGVRSRQYQFPTIDVPESDRVIKQGYALKDVALPIQQSLISKPVFTFIRPFDRAFGGVDKTSLRFVRREESTNGARHVVLERRFGAGGPVERYWVDPQVAHGMVRYAAEDGSGKLFCQVDVTWRLDTPHGWLPDAWTIASFGPSGAATFAESCKVTRFRLNAPMPDDTFDIQFPEGTRVFADNGKNFLAREGGDLQLLPGGPAQVPARRRLSGTSWTLMVAASTALTLLGVLLWLRRKSRLNVRRAHTIQRGVNQVYEGS